MSTETPDQYLSVPDEVSKPQRTEGVFEQAQSEITSLIHNPALQDLLLDFGFTPPEGTTPLRDELAALKTFTNTTWDFRAGKERSEAQQAQLREDEEAKILEVADALGMVKASTPSKKSYGAKIVLGGIGKSPLQREQYALDCGADAQLVVCLGAENELPPNRSAIQDYAPHAKTEFDLMAAAAERVFQRTPSQNEHWGVRNPEWMGKIHYKTLDYLTQLKESGEPVGRVLDNSRWRIRHYEGDPQGNQASQPDLFVLSAISSEPEKRRANTPDTYALLAELMPDVNDVLLVTTAIFQPFQHLDAMRMLALPYGKTVETIGFDTRTSKSHTPQNYLQELNSAVNSAWLLNQALQTKKS